MEHVFGPKFIEALRPFIIRRAISDARRLIADYEEECETYYREGHRPHYCIHGTNMWTDYDNICHWCEDDIRTAYDFARLSVDERVREVGDAINARDTAVLAHAPEQAVHLLNEWVVDLVRKFTPGKPFRPLHTAGV